MVNDQASILRQRLENHSGPARKTKTIAITSGKGGVGKSNFTLNLAIALSKRNQKVVVFDADFGMANIDVLMGVRSKYSLHDLINNKKTIWEVMQPSPTGVDFISGVSGLYDMLHLDRTDLEHLLLQLAELNGYADYILIDTGAGLSTESLSFILSAEEVIVVTTPEPTSITDAYALIKMVNQRKSDVNFSLVVNRSPSYMDGNVTAEKIMVVANRFLHKTIHSLGCILDDPLVQRAVMKQYPFLLLDAHSRVSKSMIELTDDFLKKEQKLSHVEPVGIQGFVNKLLGFMNFK